MAKHKPLSATAVLSLVISVLVISFAYINNLSTPKVQINQTTFKVELAQTQDERTQGLSGRSGLANDEGMLFVFDNPGFYSFWMKDMKFDLDILWINSNLRIVHIEEYVSPYDFPQTYTSPLPAKYVLEINGGSAEAAGIGLGDRVNLSGVED